MTILWTILVASIILLLLMNRKSLLNPEPFNLRTELTIGWNGFPFAIKALAKLLFGNRIYKGKSNSIDPFLYHVRRNPHKIALIYSKTAQCWSYKELDNQINKMAGLLVSKNISSGSIVALYLDNSPEFLISWFALLKLNACAAFINPNLTGQSLKHVLDVSGAELVICRSEQIDLIASVYNQQMLYFGTTEIVQDTSEKASLIDLEHFSDSPPDLKLKNSAELNDTAMLIYTSGTTGLPKASIITHSRFFAAQFAFASFTRMTKKDVLYCPLPLYHGSAALGGIGSCFQKGATFILVPKFSASNCFPECKKYNATMLQYIGELGRYLTSMPPSPKDKDHTLRLAFGNGMRKDIWLDFKHRFNIKTIVEFYGSTEGPVALANYQQHDEYGVGSMGRLGFFQSIFTPMRIVEFNAVKEEPIRNSKGFAQQCKVGDVGELVGSIQKLPGLDFKGYKGAKKQTEKKILTDLFKKGDAWFRTGDLVRMDEYGYIYFVDRIGDTFRWKGENVSTIEVSNTFSLYPGIIQANVYGVSVPNADGKAGMAALVIEAETFSMQDLASFLKSKLPFYAVPVFIRIIKDMPSTSTMKQVKFDLVQEGIDPQKVPDLYFLSSKSDKYEPFTTDHMELLNQGKIRI